jgi:glutamine amidotransferase
MRVTVVNYGIGNLLSVQRAFEHVGASVAFAEDAGAVSGAERLVVPGVGAFQGCMDPIVRRGLKEALVAFAGTGRPYLGICVGMQMLMDRSFEFGEHPGLGLIPGEVRKIDIPGERVPFIGWKPVELNGRTNRFYFVHSFEARPRQAEHVLATYSLGGRPVTAAVRKDNVLGLQFHPEKSAGDGLDLIRAFLRS